MINKKKVLLNGIFSAGQVFTVAIVFFFLYRYLLLTIGAEKLGVWALMSGIAVIMQLGNAGISSSIVRFVAKYSSLDDEKKVASIIQTSIITLATFITIFSLIIYVGMLYAMKIIIEPSLYDIANEILEPILVSFWLMSIIATVHGAIEGYQSYYIKNSLIVFSAILNLIMCYILVPIYDLKGVVFAKLISGIFTLFLSWFFLKRINKFLPLIPYQWRIQDFKETLKYTFNMQIITIAAVFFDPIVRIYISKFGDISMVAYYEMANRFIQQIRGLVVTSIRVIVPAIAHAKEKGISVKESYNTTHNATLYLSLPIISLTILVTPVISTLWFGEINSIFISFSYILSIGWFFNTLGVAAYLVNLGTGAVKWNTLGQVSIALLNIPIAYYLGTQFGGVGVVIGWVIALSIGSDITLLIFCIRNKINFKNIFLQSVYYWFFFFVLGVIINPALYEYILKSNNNIYIYIYICFYIMIAGVLVIKNPMTQKIKNMIIKRDALYQ